LKILFYPNLSKDSTFGKLCGWINEFAECGYNITDPDVIVAFNNRVLWDDLFPHITTKPKKAMYFLSQPRPISDAFWTDNMEENCDAIYSYGKSMIEAQYLKIGWLPYPVDITNIPEIQPSDTIKVVRSINKFRFGTQGMNWYKTYRAKRECEELGIPVTTLHSLAHPQYFDELIQHNLYIGRFSQPGNIGRQELEAGTSGLAVIGGFCKETMDLFRLLDKDFPFIGITKEEFKPYVANLTIEEVKRLGRLNRKWMREFYAPKRIAQYWVSELERMIK
jgi:hypothetical protein